MPKADSPARRSTMSRTRNTVVSAAPTSTTNITGFFSSVTGFSLTNDSRSARATDLRIEQRPRPRQLLRQQRRRVARARSGLRRRRRCRCRYSHGSSSRELAMPARRVVPAFIRKCSTIGPSDSAGKNVSAPTMTTVPTSRPTNSGPCVGSVPLVTGICFLAARLPAAASSGSRNRNRPIEHREAERQVVPGRVRGDAGERAAVVAGGAGVGVEDLAKPCGPALFRLAVVGPCGFQ